MRFVKLASVVLAALLLAVAVAVVALVFWFDPNAHRARLETVVSGAMGRPVSWTGRISISPSLWPTLAVEDVRLANPAWASRPEMARARRLELRLALLPLLRGALRIQHVAFVGADMLLERSAEGEGNWVFTSGEGAQVGLPAVSAVLVRDSALSYRPVSGAVLRLGIVSAQVMLGKGRPVDVRFDGNFRDTSFLLSLRGGALPELLVGAEPWPVAGRVSVGATSLAVDGQLRPAPGEQFRLRTTLRGEPAQIVNPLFGIHMPELGAFDLRGELSRSGAVYRLEAAQGTIRGSRVAGGLQLDWGGLRPRLDGDVTLRELLLGDGGDEGGMSAATAIPAKFLQSFDGALTLRLERVRGIPQQVRSGALAARLEQGRLSLTLSALRVEGTPIAGSGEYVAQDVPRARVALRAGELDVGRWLQPGRGAPAVRGTIGAATLQAEGNADTFGALLHPERLSASLARADLIFATGDMGGDVPFAVDEADARLALGEGAELRLTGRLRGKPVHLAAFMGGLPAEAANGRAAALRPVQADLRIADTSLNVSGGMRDPFALQGLDMRFALQGRLLSAFAPLLGLPLPHTPYEIRGRALGHTGGLALEGVKARAGDSDLSGRLDIAFGGARPTITADLSARHVALREFLPPADAPDAVAAPPAADGAASEVRLRKLLDLPLPTANLGVYDADVDFRAEEISGAPAELRKLALTLSLRAGALTLSPVDLTVGGEVLHGRLAYRARATPALNFNVFASQVDLHAAARRFSGQEDAQAQAQAARLSFAGNGRTPREMLAGATFALAADALSLRARGVDGRALSMALEQGRLVVTDGGPLRLNVTGRLGGQALNVAATGGNMASLLAEDGAWPIEAELVLGKLQLDAEGALGLARDTPRIELALSIAGAQMADLQPALPFRLPPLGPFKLTAVLQGGTQGLSLHDIKGRIGDNELAGKVEWGIAGGRPLVTAGIVVERLQLPADEPDAASEPARSEPPARGTLERPYPLELLRGLDADLDLRIKRISRGGTRLGDARFHAQLHHGRLTLDPLRAQVLGGIVQGRVTLDATGSAPPQTFEGTVRDFDYGALMQVLGVSRLVEGKVDLDFAVSGQGGSLKETLRTLEGTAAFTGSRGKVENRYLRFWGTNLFLIWRPFFRDETVTRINCAAGRFEIEQGVATARKLVVDTPEITIRGTGTMDFGADRIALNLRPKSKSISLISLATAVDVTGQLSQPNIGVAPATIAENLTWLALGLTFPQALVLGFGSTGERDGNPCADKPEAEAEQSSRIAAPQN